MALSIGTTAPDFTLAPAPGPDTISLSDYRGKENIVLMFMPLAFSGVCTDEVCAMAENLSQWGSIDAKVLGVTVDSPFITAKFAAETKAGFPILSDFNKKTITAYDVRYEDFFGMQGVAKRSVFVIDREGTIQYAWVTEDAGVLPPFDDIKSAVEGLS